MADGMVAAPPRHDAAVLYGGQRAPVGAEGLGIGRRSENAVVLATERASRRHARVHATPEGTFWLEDLGSLNGTYLNGERLRGESRWLASGDTITIGGEQLRFVLGTATSYGTAQPERVDRFQLTTRRITIGRDQTNDIWLNSPAVSRFHAEVVAGADGHAELRDLGSTNGTRVNGQLVPAAKLGTGAEVGIGPYRLIFDGLGLIRRDERGRVRLDAENVTVRAGDKTILAGASLSIAPGELVAIIGESGAGKTTLIKTLAGVSAPSDGAVRVSGEPIESRLTDVGYVPQDDIVHRLLTVREALRYSARLRLPEDVSRADVDAAVERVLRDVALAEHADTRIDSLSGGQRKRAGVGVELLTEPGLLFLDEPTTGLDPQLESRLMRLLRELADGGRAVTVITHATKNLNTCDRLVVMGRGGVLAFHGPPEDALRFFGVSSYDGIYAALEERAAAEWRELFETGAQPAEQDAAPPDPPQLPLRRSALRQTRVLAARYLRVMARDRRNLMILLGQVPVLALLAAGLFRSDVFRHGPGHAGNSAQLLFLLVTTAIWLGSIDAAREIVKERSIAARERAAGTRLSAYLGSKLIVLCGLAALQTGALAAIVFALRPLAEPPSVYATVVGLLVLTSLVAVGTGLLISALVRTQDQATSLIPIALIPQLFFAGAIVPVERMGEPVGALSAAVFAQWSFAGTGTAVDMHARIAADPRFTNGYGHSFFDVSPGIAAIVLVGFFEVFVLLVALRLRRGQAE